MVLCPELYRLKAILMADLLVEAKMEFETGGWGSFPFHRGVCLSLVAKFLVIVLKSQVAVQKEHSTRPPTCFLTVLFCFT